MRLGLAEFTYVLYVLVYCTKLTVAEEPISLQYYVSSPKLLIRFRESADWHYTCTQNIFQ
jgi:hypothetical protein